MYVARYCSYSKSYCQRFIHRLLYIICNLWSKSLLILQENLFLDVDLYLCPPAFFLFFFNLWLLLCIFECYRNLDGDLKPSLLNVRSSFQTLRVLVCFGSVGQGASLIQFTCYSHLLNSYWCSLSVLLVLHFHCHVSNSCLYMTCWGQWWCLVSLCQ